MEIMLDMLKVDLGITGNAYDARLPQYLDYSRQEIQNKGVTLDVTSVVDQQLVVM